MGRRHALLPGMVHAIAMASAVELAIEWTSALVLVGLVVFSAIDECRRWWRECRTPQTLVLIPGGIEIDSVLHSAMRAWLGPGCTAIWIKTEGGQRRLLYVFRGEVTDAGHAALRRHAKSFDLA